MRERPHEMTSHLLREFRRAHAVIHRFGLAKATTKAANYPFRLMASRLSYLRNHRRYPSNVIFMASLAKSGSTWLANMLAGLPGFSRYQPAGWTASFLEKPNQDLYPGVFEEARNRLVVIKGHTEGTPENAAYLREQGLRYLVTVRDPRDQLISGYWYLRNHPLHPSHQLALELQIDEFITHELDSTNAEIRRADWLRRWIRNRDPSLSMMVRYEDLLSATNAELGRILAFLDFEIPDSTIEQIVAANSFVEASGRSPGTEDQHSFFRRGTAGEWKQVFSDEHKERFSSQMEDLVSALGYEPTMSTQ